MKVNEAMGTGEPTAKSSPVHDENQFAAHPDVDPSDDSFEMEAVSERGKRGLLSLRDQVGPEDCIV